MAKNGKKSTKTNQKKHKKMKKNCTKCKSLTTGRRAERLSLELTIVNLWNCCCVEFSSRVQWGEPTG
jgi:hypothetical protein